MYLLQLFLSYLGGLALLLLAGILFNVSNKLYLSLAISSLFAGILLFVFSFIGYKFVYIVPLSYFLTGFFGVFGLIFTIILKIVF